MLTRIIRWLQGPTTCSWCGQPVNPATGYRNSGSWYCSEDHAAQDQELSAP